MIAIYDENNAIRNRWIHGAGVDEPLAIVHGSSGARKYLIKDERGSIIARTYEDGTPLHILTYDSYGREGDGNIGRFGYTGQTVWRDLGLVYFKARWYNPEIGRFMQSDPIGYGDGMNMYGYVGGDPVNFTDPSELSRLEDYRCRDGGATCGSHGAFGALVICYSSACAAQLSAADPRNQTGSSDGGKITNNVAEEAKRALTSLGFRYTLGDGNFRQISDRTLSESPQTIEDLISQAIRSDKPTRRQQTFYIQGDAQTAIEDFSQLPRRRALRCQIFLIIPRFLDTQVAVLSNGITLVYYPRSTRTGLPTISAQVPGGRDIKFRYLGSNI